MQVPFSLYVIKATLSLLFIAYSLRTVDKQDAIIKRQESKLQDREDYISALHSHIDVLKHARDEQNREHHDLLLRITELKNRLNATKQT